MRSIVLALACASALAGGCSIAPGAAGTRPENWARPVAASPEVANLHRVSSSLYRSAQPSRQGFVFLSGQPSLVNEDRPIKTVLSLRAFNDDAPLIPPS